MGIPYPPPDKDTGGKAPTGVADPGKEPDSYTAAATHALSALVQLFGASDDPARRIPSLDRYFTNLPAHVDLETGVLTLEGKKPAHLTTRIDLKIPGLQLESATLEEEFRVSLSWYFDSGEKFDLSLFYNVTQNRLTAGGGKKSTGEAFGRDRTWNADAEGLIEIFKEFVIFSKEHEGDFSEVEQLLYHPETELFSARHYLTRINIALMAHQVTGRLTTLGRPNPVVDALERLFFYLSSPSWVSSNHFYTTTLRWKQDDQTSYELDLTWNTEEKTKYADEEKVPNVTARKISAGEATSLYGGGRERRVSGLKKAIDEFADIVHLGRRQLSRLLTNRKLGVPDLDQLALNPDLSEPGIWRYRLPITSPHGEAAAVTTWGDLHTFAKQAMIHSREDTDVEIIVDTQDFSTPRPPRTLLWRLMGHIKSFPVRSLTLILVGPNHAQPTAYRITNEWIADSSLLKKAKAKNTVSGGGKQARVTNPVQKKPTDPTDDNGNKGPTNSFFDPQHTPLMLSPHRFGDFVDDSLAYERSAQMLASRQVTSDERQTRIDTAKSLATSQGYIELADYITSFEPSDLRELPTDVFELKEWMSERSYGEQAKQLDQDISKAEILMIIAATELGSDKLVNELTGAENKIKSAPIRSRSAQSTMATRTASITRSARIFAIP